MGQPSAELLFQLWALHLPKEMDKLKKTHQRVMRVAKVVETGLLQFREDWLHDSDLPKCKRQLFLTSTEDWTREGLHYSKKGSGNSSGKTLAGLCCLELEVLTWCMMVICQELALPCGRGKEQMTSPASSRPLLPEAACVGGALWRRQLFCFVKVCCTINPKKITDILLRIERYITFSWIILAMVTLL